MTMGIYAIYSTIDDSCLYVGLSKHCEARFKQHLKNLRTRHSSCLASFADWFHEAGARPELLRFVILGSYDREELNAQEALWFNSLQPRFYGKRPSLREKWSLTEATRLKIAQSALGDREVLWDATGNWYTLHTCEVCKASYDRRRGQKARRTCSLSCASRVASLETNEELRLRARLLREAGLGYQAIARELHISVGKAHGLLNKKH